MKVGQTVYLKPKENSRAWRRNPNPIKSVIEKVGTKYITVEIYGQFYKKSLKRKSEYNSDYTLFLSKEDLDLETERCDLSNRIKNSIPKYSKWNIEVEKLRKIAEILEC